MPFINAGPGVSSGAAALWQDSGGTVSLISSSPIDLNTGTDPLKINGSEGSSGQVLTSNGPALPPTWETPSSGGSSQWQEAAGVVTLVNNTNVVSLNGTNGTMASPLVFNVADNTVASIKTTAGNLRSISLDGSASTGGQGGTSRIYGGTATGGGSIGGTAGAIGGDGGGQGGLIYIQSGAATDSGGTGGAVSVTSGAVPNGGNSGQIDVVTPNASTQSGGIRISTGDASTVGSIRLITAYGYGGGFAKSSTIEIGYAGATAEVRVGQNSDQSRVNVYGGLATFQRVFGSTASANSDGNPPWLQLGRANVNLVSGTSNVDGIVVDEYSAPNTRWLAGSSVTLIFQSAMTVRHNITPPNATIARLLLAGSVSMTTAANTVLGLVFDGTNWQEIFRKVP